MSDTVYLGRQPILDRQRRTYGYELLDRSADRNEAMFSDPDDATRVVVERAMLEWGLEHVLHGRTASSTWAPASCAAGSTRPCRPST